MYNPVRQWAFFCLLKFSTLARLTAISHLLSVKTHHTQLKMTSSQNLSLFSILIIIIFFFFCRLELQLSLVAMVVAHYESGSSVGR